jgi:hypothetical protein
VLSPILWDTTGGVYFFGFLVFFVLITPPLGAVFYMLDQEPNFRFSTLFVKHKEIGGPIPAHHSPRSSTRHRAMAGKTQK